MIVVNQGLLERDKLQRHPVGQGEPEVAMIKAIKFASVPVSDQDRALDFYTQKLGFEVATDIPFDDNQRWIELRIQDSETRLVLFTPRGQEDRIGSFSNIVFVSDDVDETYRELVARGVEFVQEPKKADWGTAAVLRDPDGNSFVISSE
jgi:predicted enzyme related to lactoylglutathione lyase